MVWANTAFGLALNAAASKLTGVGPVVLTKAFELPHALAAHAKTTREAVVSKRMGSLTFCGQVLPARG
jgi:hypothetical protein